jgi:hypothetical protein
MEIKCLQEIFIVCSRCPFSVSKIVKEFEKESKQYKKLLKFLILFPGLGEPEGFHFNVTAPAPEIKTSLKVGTNENGSACGRWLSIGI